MTKSKGHTRYNGEFCRKNNLLRLLFAAALLLCTWGNATALADPVNGQPITEITWNAAPDLPTDLVQWTDDEKAAVIRAAEYWNDVLDTETGAWAERNFNGIIDFDKYTADLGDARAHAGGTHVSARPNITESDGMPTWTVAENTQFTILIDTDHSNSFEATMIHELAHSLGIGGNGDDAFTVSDDGTTVTFNIDGADLPTTWGKLLRAPGGADILQGETYTLAGDDPDPYDESKFFTFNGDISKAVYGDKWHIGTDKNVPVISGPTGFLGHLFFPASGVSTYQWPRRPFLAEAEMAVMADLGHDIKIDRFYGRSIYGNYIDSIVVDNTNADVLHGTVYTAADGTTGWTGDGKFAVGLHIVHQDQSHNPGITDPGNNVTVKTHLVSTGEYGTGIRIEGWNHNVTIDDNIIVAATGKDGIGVLFAGMGGWSGGTTLNIAGTIIAQQEEDGTLTRAIVVDPAKVINDPTTNLTTVSAINVTGDAVITGIIDILNDNNITVQNGASLGTTAGLQFATGNLVMDLGSTLKFNLADDEEAYKIVFASGTLADIGTANIEVSALTAGTYTLIDSENLTFSTPSLKYKGTSIANTTANVGHRKNFTYTFADTNDDLSLTMTDDGFTNIAQNWTGTAQNNLWDTTSENWSNIDKTFADGDAVTFDIEESDTENIVTHSINVVETRTIADMSVRGADNWVFNGNITGVSSTDISGSGGALTKDGTGSLTLNGNNVFNAVSIDGGTTVVTDANKLTSSGGVAVGVAGTLTGNGTVESNVTVGGTLSAGDTAGEIGMLTIDGDLTMEDDSTLAVNLGRDEPLTSDKIDVTGTTTLGDIDLNMQSLFRKGTYTLITSDIFNAGSFAADIFLGGDAIEFDTTTTGRLAEIAPTAVVNENGLQLTVDADQENIALEWSGDNAGNGVWNHTTSNWTGSSDSYFLSGDAVTFDLEQGALTGDVTHNIDVVGTKTVADMTVSGRDHWIFSGGSIVGTTDDNATTIDDGTGTLTMDGTGTLTLLTDAAFEGGVAVNSGQLHIGDGGVVGDFAGDITTGANATVAFNRSDAVTYSNVISGGGDLNKLGAGTLILTGVNTYTGDTTIAAGTLQIGNGGTGSIGLDKITVEGGANLVFNRSDTVSINDTIFGGGTTKVASGTLGGNGTIEGSFIVESGATFSPGNSYGTFTVGGDVTFENGSTYLYEVDNNSQTQEHDLLVVSEPTSTITIEDGAVLDIHLTGETKRGDEFQVIAANELQFQGANFSATDGDPRFTIEGNFGTEFYQDILNDGYYIGWRAVAPEFVNAIEQYSSPNALNTATGIDEIVELAEQAGIIDQLYNVDFYDALTNIGSSDPGALARAFEQLHGEVFASSKEAAAQLQRSFTNLMPTGREIVKLSDVSKPTNRWGMLTGETQSRDNIGKFSGYDLTSTGLAIGIDRAVMGNLLIGAALGYDYATQDFDSIRAKSQIDAFRTMVYTRWYNGTYFVDAYGGYTKNYFENERYINIDPLNTTARSKYDADLGSVGLDIGKTMWVGKTLFTPSMGIHYIHMDDQDATETGAGSANLFVTGEDYQSLRMPMGFKASQTFSEENGLVWTPEVRLYYVREWMDDSARVYTAFDGYRGSSFVAESGNWGRDSGQAGAGVSARLSNMLSARLDYDFEFYKNTNAHVFTGSLGVNW